MNSTPMTGNESGLQSGIQQADPLAAKDSEDQTLEAFSQDSVEYAGPRTSRAGTVPIPRSDGLLPGTAGGAQDVAAGRVISDALPDDEEPALITPSRRFREEWPEQPGETSESREQNAGWSPPIDIFEQAASVIVQAELPGLSPQDVRVVVTDECLTIQGERKRQREESAEGHSERKYGRFYRRALLPDGVNSDQASAQFENGLLEVCLPLLETHRQGREISIRAAVATGKPPAPSKTADPSWWKQDYTSSWDRVKDAFRRDWLQTKHDMGRSEPDLNQDLKDTVGQAAGRQPIPPPGQPNPKADDRDYAADEPAFRFGYGARKQYGGVYPEWDERLEAHLRSDWRVARGGAETDWERNRRLIRRGWDFAGGPGATG